MNFIIDKQRLTRADHYDEIIANSTDYLEVDFEFSYDWTTLTKTAYFKHEDSESAIAYLLVDDKITKDMHLNLSSGNWKLNVYGVNGTTTVITNSFYFKVYESELEDGVVPPIPTESEYAQILDRLAYLETMIEDVDYQVPAIPNSIVKRDVNGGIATNSIKLSTSPTTTPIVGELYYNQNDFVPNFQSIDGVSIQIGSENLQVVNNKSGSTIQDGTLVAWTSTDGQSGNVNVVPYVANGTIDSERIMGVATHDIENGTSGLVTFWGKLRGINTTGSTVGETWTNGTILYAHPTQAGKYTSVKPQYPNRATRIGIVINAHSNAGTLLFQRTQYFRASDIQVVDSGNYFGGAHDLESVLQFLGSKIPT